MSDTQVIGQICDERRRLFIAYQEAAASYSEVIRKLANAVGAIARREFDFVNRKVIAARKLCIEARDRLDKHIREHQC